MVDGEVFYCPARTPLISTVAFCVSFSGHTQGVFQLFVLWWPTLWLLLLLKRGGLRAVSATPAYFPRDVFGKKAWLCHRGITANGSE